jgi:dihydrodipicolinate synthase/N-acetylneuraminate lyase
MVNIRHRSTLLATCCVPWDERGELLEDVFRASIATLAGHGFRDLYVFGTAGEGHAVDERRFDAVTSVFVDEARAAGAAPMVGLISMSLPTVIDRIERAAALGVDAFQLSLPSWGALNDRELERFFDETCGRFPELRFLHYNLPRAQRFLAPREYRGLADRHPNLVATKNAGASNAQIAGLFAHAPELRHFFTEPGYAYASLLGECGFLVSVGLLDPQRAIAFHDAGQRRDAAALAPLARDVASLTEELHRVLGTAHMDGAYDKVFSHALDPAFPLRLLPPYESATDEAFEAFLTVVRDRFPHWIGG